jgi:hypothetical protein
LTSRRPEARLEPFFSYPLTAASFIGPTRRRAP